MVFILFFLVMKKYWSLIGISALIFLVGLLGYQAFFAYLAEHTYYLSILSSWQNRWVFFSAIICALLPVSYLILCSEVKVKNLIIWFVAWAWLFGLVHSNIKWDPIWLWHIITIFNTLLLVCLWVYLILWFSALWSWIERKWIKFNELRRQEIFLSFWVWFSVFVVIVQILLWIWLLYWIVSWILFLWLGFMIWYERVQVWKWWEILSNILNKFRIWFVQWERNIKSKKIWFLCIFLPIILSLAYLYMWIQNAFVPYSTAWDANHEYMYVPKILAENAWIYWWNTVGSSMPWFWHQFLTFIFSLTGCTNWWLGLSPDNIAISMNNMSAFFVLIFWVAVVFQIFSLIGNRKESLEESEMRKWNNKIVDMEVENVNWITMWRYILLLRLTGWMWAFLVIVDNKTDLWVMALSLLALLAGLIFLQNRKFSGEKKEMIKYVLIAWLFFWFATLAKITAFVDFVLFGLLLVWLWFSSITSLGLWIMVMGLVRKFNILTSSVMLTNANANRFIIIWWIITVVWFVVCFLKRNKREEFWKNIKDLIILGISFLIPLIVLKLPRAVVSQIKTDNYSFWNSLKAVFLSMGAEDKKWNYNKFLAQNIKDEENFGVGEVSDSDDVDSMEEQNEIDNSILNTKKQQYFYQCSSAWNIYSDEELNQWLQEIIWGQWWEDFWRYIWYGWKEFKKTNIFSVDEDKSKTKWFKFFKSMWPKSGECEWFSDSDNVICERNLSYWLLKLLRKTSDTCYWFDHDAKVLCNNAWVIDNFKIDDLRAIYENGINSKDSEAWLLLKEAIDAYDEAKSEWKIWFWSSNVALFHDEIVNLRQYYQSHSILSTESSVYVPYRYLVPLNISFNWSLQNLSSYYTDTGFFWIIVYLLLFVALFYAIFRKDRVQISIILTTLIWWWIRWIIWSSILWYWTVLISWTMIALAIFWNELLQNNWKKGLNIVSWILITFVWVIFWVQLIFNFLRISSQWANSVFVWYKWNVWMVQTIDDNLEAVNKTKIWYVRKNIFNLQFPQYNPIINALANRDNQDWVIVAWTYIQYFLWNQWNIKSDWMLSEFWKKTSDWDLCKTYWRIKWDNTRYLIIDPNIGTVTMWEWNETLFYRFFGKLNSDKSKIEIDWTITTLIRLYKAWYLKLLSTNNIWSKYAFSLDDSIIRSYFGEDLTDEELILIRWKMAVLQYFDDANSIFSSIAWIFLSRVMGDTKWWIEDIANIYWFEIDVDKVATVAVKFINWQRDGLVEWLTNEEKTVLITYVNLYSWYKQWWENAISKNIQDLLLGSVTWWSQIVALELN